MAQVKRARDRGRRRVHRKHGSLARSIEVVDSGVFPLGANSGLTPLRVVLLLELHDISSKLPDNPGLAASVSWRRAPRTKNPASKARDGREICLIGVLCLQGSCSSSSLNRGYNYSYGYAVAQTECSRKRVKGLSRLCHW